MKDWAGSLWTNISTGRVVISSRGHRVEHFEDSGSLSGNDSLSLTDQKQISAFMDRQSSANIIHLTPRRDAQFVLI